MTTTGTPTAVVPYDPFRSAEDLSTYARLTDLPFLDVTHPRFGATGDGVANDVAAVASAAAELSAAGGGVLLFPAGRTFYLPSTIAEALPAYNTIIDARGAIITTDVDDVLFDINPDQITDGFDGSDTNTLRKLAIVGGKWVSTAATKTASIAIRAWGMRHFVVDGAYFEGWYKAIEVAGKDTYSIDGCYFYQNKYDVYHPDDATTGIAALDDLPLEINLGRNHHSCNNGTSAVYIGTKVLGLKVRDSSFNGTTTGPQVHCKDSSLLAGEGYLFSGCHFEQIGTAGAIKMDDANGTGFYALGVDGCVFVSGSTAGWKGLLLNRVRGTNIRNTVFRDGTGGATEVAITGDANCQGLVIDDATRRSMQGIATPLSWAAARSQYRVQPEFRPSAAVVVTGYNAAAMASGSNVAMDMSSIASSLWPTVGVPIAWDVAIYAADSASAASAPSVLVKSESGATSNAGLILDLGGVTNGQFRHVRGTVMADANGDLVITTVASGGAVATLTVTLYVVGVHM